MPEGGYSAVRPAGHERALVIAHIIESLEVGGAEMMVASLCRWQRRQGHEPSVHCLLREGRLFEQLRDEGFPAYYHGPPSRWGLHRRLHEFFARRERPDVIHCHNATATIIATPAARLAGVRVVVSTRHGLVAPPYGWRREVQFSIAARGCAAVVAVCEAACRNLRRAPLADHRRIHTIYNGAEPAASQPPNPAVPAKEGFTAITVGRLTPAKDQAGLLRAVAQAARCVPDLRLWLAGDGPLGPDLRRLATELRIAERVVFCGDQPCVGDFLAAADLFVLSSITEGLPISLLEAMAAGLPCLVTDVGGMPEIVRPSGGGSIVPPSQPEALAEMICAYARARDRLSLEGENARRHYQQHFTFERMASDYLHLYECAIAGRPFARSAAG